MKWKKILIGVTVTAVTLFGAGWLFGWFSNSAAIAEVQQLQAKAADPNLSDTDRRTLFEQMRTKMDALPDSARREVREAGRQVFEQRMEARISEILAMPPAQRIKALDADIDQAEKRRAEWAKRAQANASQTGAKGGQPGANGQKGGGQRRPVAVNDSQRVDRLKNRLDRSSPESRAKRNAYAQLVNQRRQQRGLPPTTGGGPGGPGRGGR
jgi:hypothetical protein